MKLADLLDDRLGMRRRFRKALEHPIAGGPSWARSAGFTLVFLLVVLTLTGVALTTSYAPTIESAWASVHYTTYILPHGWLLRGLHHFSAEAMLVLACGHVAMLAIGGAHRKPREIGYLAALVAIGAIAAACITGGVLPWDQRGYWARRVELAIVAMAPGGADFARLVQGGDTLGQLALGRMFALHVIVLPLVIAALFRLRRRSEWTFAEKISARHNTGFESYVPRQLARDLAVAASTAILIGYATNKMHGAPLDAPADPSSDYPARPEWYLMWLYEVRRHAHGAMEVWATLAAPTALFAFFFALPWIDKRKHGPSVVGSIAVLVAFGAIASLTYVSLDRDMHDAKYQKAHAEARAHAKIAIDLAMKGVPPAGPLVMLRNDPELRGGALFSNHCASCHVLGKFGDAKKAEAPALDGWSQAPWILAMLHDPDGDSRFGRTPFKEQMPSMDVAPKDKDDFVPMSKDEMNTVATFLSAQSDGSSATGDGQKILEPKCTGCHLFEGRGDDDGTGNAPELSGYGSVAWIRAQIDDPSSKTTYRENALDPKMKHHMPKFAGDLSASDIDLLARWTYAKVRGASLD
jgi:ubiquinol-cytochrome c reductase cytochrome b subunit